MRIHFRLAEVCEEIAKLTQESEILRPALERFENELRRYRFDSSLTHGKPREVDSVPSVLGCQVDFAMGLEHARLFYRARFLMGFLSSPQNVVGHGKFDPAPV